MNITIRNNTSTIKETFWTDATDEDILYAIKVNGGREDLIRKWDRDKIVSNVGWVSYHLRRAGFYISEKKCGEVTYVKVVDEMELI